MFRLASYFYARRKVSELHSEITNKHLDPQSEFGTEVQPQAKEGTNAELAMPETTHPHRVPRALPSPRRQLLAHAKLHLDGIITMREPSRYHQSCTTSVLQLPLCTASQGFDKASSVET